MVTVSTAIAGGRAHHAAFDFHPEHLGVRRLSPPTAWGKADLGSGLLSELGERGHTEVFLSRGCI